MWSFLPGFGEWSGYHESPNRIKYYVSKYKTGNLIYCVADLLYKIVMSVHRRLCNFWTDQHIWILFSGFGIYDPGGEQVCIVMTLGHTPLALRCIALTVKLDIDHVALDFAVFSCEDHENAWRFDLWPHVTHDKCQKWQKWLRYFIISGYNGLFVGLVE